MRSPLDGVYQKRAGGRSAGMQNGRKREMDGRHRARHVRQAHHAAPHETTRVGSGRGGGGGGEGKTAGKEEWGGGLRARSCDGGIMVRPHKTARMGRRMSAGRDG